MKNRKKWKIQYIKCDGSVHWDDVGFFSVFFYFYFILYNHESMQHFYVSGKNSDHQQNVCPLEKNTGSLLEEEESFFIVISLILINSFSIKSLFKKRGDKEF